jgi:iron complex outermembrane receptor protein
MKWCNQNKKSSKYIYIWGDTMRKLTSLMLPLSAIALAVSAGSAVAADGANTDMEEVVITGLRGKPRSAGDSAVPIDTFSAEQISSISHTDTVDILQTLVPSFNVGREPISDGASFIRPIELRGLPSHHTLVLVNGKRRHRASLVGIGGAGTQGPDIATIPSTAINSIEVLRDGASSQYGSDAIAGVINFNLKENRSGFDLSMSTGEFFEGDGAGYTVAANVGLPLGENGFLSISAEVDDQDFTERGHQYCENWFCVDPNGDRLANTSAIDQGFTAGVPSAGADPFLAGLQAAYPAGVAAASLAGTNVQPWGQPNTSSTRLFYNAGIDLSDSMEVYSFGSYSSSEGDGGFFYRYPFNGVTETVRSADGAQYNPLQIFPGGFTPRFMGEIEDSSFAAGIRGQNGNGFSYDVSARIGSNEIEYTLSNTINPSYGSDTPTSFKPGTLVNEEVQFQLDLANEMEIGTDSPLIVAYGLSYLDETYDVQQSPQLASYGAGPHSLSDPYGFCSNEADFSMRTPTAAAGGGAFTSSIGGQTSVAGAAVAGLDCTNSSDPAYKVVGVGSNGFPGYSPAFSEEYTRDSYALYADLSTDITEDLFAQFAIRYEDYSDFGSEVVGKIAGRYRLSDTMAIRGSYGTGFRAPTPGQQGTTNVSTRLPNGFPVATGLFPASGPIAQALGATPLAPETSSSFTVGLTADLGELTMTIDLYSIDIDDRFSAISTLDVSSDPTAGADYQNFLALQNAGVSGAETIGGVFYFTNAFDSNTTGVDVVASYPLEWGNGQETALSLAFNYNKSSLESDASAFLNEEDRFDFENQDPTIRWNLTANHNVGDLSLMARARYYGESDNSNSSGNLVVQTFDPTLFVDLEASYRFMDNWLVSVGGRNIFDTFPDETDKVASNNDFCCGRDFASSGIVPWQGGYYYGRVALSF